MDQETFETLTLSADTLGEDRGLLVDNVEVQIHRYNGQPIGIVFPPHVELTVTKTEMGVRGNTASGSVTKPRCSRPVSRSRCRCSSRKAKR